MLPIDKYGTMYLAMTGAITDPELQEQICTQHGVTLAEWHAANAHYMAKMSDVSDMGQTAMALAKYMMPQPAAPQPVAPQDFTATDIHIYVNEFQVQMLEFQAGNRYVELQKSVATNPNDEFLTNYVKGRVHLSINKQDYSIYGGVQQVKLSRNRITFVFDDEGAGRMQTAQVSVLFTVSNKKYAYLLRTLKIMYNEMEGVLQTEPVTLADTETVDGMLFDTSWGTFMLNEDFRVQLRPNLAAQAGSGLYRQAVGISYDNSQGSPEQFEMAKNELITCFESDYSTLFAMILRRNDYNQFFIYSRLDQGNFMTRLNEALCYLPQIPISINKREDSDWNEYMQCVQDYRERI